MNNIKLVEKLQGKKQLLFTEIGKVIVGQHDIIDHLFSLGRVLPTVFTANSITLSATGTFRIKF